MTLKHHTDLTLDRWCNFSLMEQLSNIGCDVERTIRWQNKNKLDYSTDAFERTLELLDLTIADPKNRGPRLKELTRMREALVDYFMYDNEYGSSDKLWQDYFYFFAYAAALERGR